MMNRSEAVAHVPAMKSSLLNNGSTLLHVSWGPETFTPISYHTFVVGPFSSTITVPEGSNVFDAAKREYALLEAFAQDVFEKKSKKFLAMVSGLKRSVGGA